VPVTDQLSRILCARTSTSSQASPHLSSECPAQGLIVDSETYNLFTNLLFFVIITKSSEVFPIHSIRRVGWAGSSVWTKFTSIRQVKFPQKTSVQHDRFAVVDAREKGVSANVS
jgi:hypothetical protein